MRNKKCFLKKKMYKQGNTTLQLVKVGNNEYVSFFIKFKDGKLEIVNTFFANCQQIKSMREFLK